MTHPKADVRKALKRAADKIKRLKADEWLAATEESRTITIVKDEDALSNEAVQKLRVWQERQEQAEQRKRGGHLRRIHASAH